MENQMGAIWVAAICGVVLLVGAVKRRAEWLLNIVMRSILGTIAVYFVNGGLAALGISLGVGINAVTVLTSGFLGIPGLLALYGLGIYRML